MTATVPGEPDAYRHIGRSTLFLNSTRLDVQIPTQMLTIGAEVGVTVVNPEPDGQASNTLHFTVIPTHPDAPQGGPSLFVPHVGRER